MSFNWQFRSYPVTPTITAGAYSANDVLGGLLSLDLGNGAVGGYIHSLLIVDDDNEKAAFNIYVFDTAPTAINDNDALALTVADLKNLCPPVIAVAATDYTTHGANAYMGMELLKKVPFRTVGGTLYVYVSPTGTPTYTATTDLYFEFGIFTYQG